MSWHKAPSPDSLMRSGKSGACSTAGTTTLKVAVYSRWTEMKGFGACVRGARAAAAERLCASPGSAGRSQQRLGFHSGRQHRRPLPHHGDIFDGVRGLVPFPRQRHRRPDLTSRPLHLRVRDYLVAYAPEENPFRRTTLSRTRRNLPVTSGNVFRRIVNTTKSPGRMLITVLDAAKHHRPATHGSTWIPLNPPQ